MAKKSKAKSAARKKPAPRKKVGQQVKAMDRNKKPPRGSKAKPDTRKLAQLKPDAERKIRELSAAWSGNIPAGAAASGAHDFAAERARPPTPHPLAGVEHKEIPGGRYRVEGNDWILTVGRGGKLESVERARPDVDPSDYITVPPNTPMTPLGPTGRAT